MTRESMTEAELADYVSRLETGPFYDEAAKKVTIGKIARQEFVSALELAAMLDFTWNEGAAAGRADFANCTCGCDLALKEGEAE